MPEVIDYNERARPRAAAHDRLRRRDLRPPGGPEHPARHVRAEQPAVVAQRDAVGLRVPTAADHDLDRIAPELERGFAHFPAVGRAGIKKFVNGPFTFSPDGNPLVGPITGMRGMWVACAVMAGLSQGGGVGLSLANWMIDGDPHDDIWAMDVARYGDWATLAYTNAKVRENYSRRFRITFPNEELPAGAPAAHDADLRPPHRAQRGVGRRLRARASAVVPGARPRTGRERHVPPLERVRDGGRGIAGRARAGRAVSEASNFAKYRVSGEGAADWLQGLFTNRLPKIGRTQPDGDAQPARPHRRRVLGLAHRRRRVLPVRVAGRRGAPSALVPRPPAEAVGSDAIRFEVLALSMVGLTVAGPRRPRRAADADQHARWRPPTSRSWRSAKSISAWRRCGCRA